MLRPISLTLAPALLPIAVACSAPEPSPPDPNKPVAELVKSHAVKQLLPLGIVTMIPVADIAKAMLEGPICSPMSKAEFRPDGTWSESEVDPQGKIVRTIDGTWVAEPTCYRMTLGPQKLGCLNETSEVVRGKDGARYVVMPAKVWTPCP